MEADLNDSVISVSEDTMSSDSEAVSTSCTGTAPSITWVSPATLGKKWDSELWSTDLFVVSRAVFAGKRKVKCIACEQLHRSRSGWESGYSFCLYLSTSFSL
jgi:hypothetical protein